MVHVLNAIRMNARLRLSDLLPGRAGQLAGAGRGIATGFPALDDELPAGGWPRAGLTELLCPSHGIGEFRLLAPALGRLCEEENRWIAWINPPHAPYAPALSRLGIDIAKVLLVYPKDHREALWAFEQTLATGACSAALGWLGESKLRFTDIRRLQLAARRGSAWANLFRPVSAAVHASPAELRLEATAACSAPYNRLRLAIRKRRGGWPVDGIEVELGGGPAACPRAEYGELLRQWLGGEWRHVRVA